MEKIIFEIPQEKVVIINEVFFDKEKIKEFCERLKKEAIHTVHYDYKALYGPLIEKYH